MTTAAAFANWPKTFKERDQWICCVLASSLPHAAVRVYTRLAMHLNLETGRCDPSFDTLSRETHIPERSVYRLVALLEAQGWIGTERTRGRLKNLYALINPNPDATSGLDPDTTSGLKAANPDKATRVNPDAMTGLNHPTLTKRTSNPDKTRTSTLTKRASHIENSEENSEGNSVKRRTRAPPDASLRKKSKPAGAPLDRPRKPKKKDKLTAADRSGNRAAPGAGAAAQPVVALDDAFAAFWAAYPRREAKEPARKAFAQAVEGGADPEAIIAGAKRYAAKRAAEIRAGDPPKYTLQAARWLDEGRWTDEDHAAGAPTIDEDGNPVEDADDEVRGLDAFDREVLRLRNGGGW
jgi:hypothetical protein